MLYIVWKTVTIILWGESWEKCNTGYGGCIGVIWLIIKYLLYGIIFLLFILIVGLLIALSIVPYIVYALSSPILAFITTGMEIILMLGQFFC